MKRTSAIIQTPCLYESHNSHIDIITEPIPGELIVEDSAAEVFEDVNNSSVLYKKYDLAGNQYHEAIGNGKGRI